MPTSKQSSSQSEVTSHEWLTESMASSLYRLGYFDPIEDKTVFEALVQASIRHHGFGKTLKELQRLYASTKSRKCGPGLFTVTGGVLEVDESGQVDAAIDTEEGERLTVSGRRTDRTSRKGAVSSKPSSEPLGPEQLIANILDAGKEIPPHLICEAEFAEFDAAQRTKALPLLLGYISNHRKSENTDVLVAVGSAIRKYIAIMPMNEMGSLSQLLVPANHDPLSLEQELEVAKMVYRNFEVHPPTDIDPEPELALRLWQIAEAYLNPRILLRNKHSAVASLAIEAIVAMRSNLAAKAWGAAMKSEYKWFGEMVTDDLSDLQQRWTDLGSAAGTWLVELRKQVLGSGESKIAEHT